MVERQQLELSKDIQRQTGRTFHVATRVLPEHVRHPTYVLYAFFRIADEVVDDPQGRTAEEQRAELESIRRAALGETETDDPVLVAFRDLREAYEIPNLEIDEFIDAMAQDIDTHRYETYADLEGYLRGSSVAVAYMMLELMDSKRKETARPHAKALGEAFQLTNFLRDVREDVLDRDRVYLPLETLRRHGVDERDVETLTFSPGFASALREELRRTERLYREGVAGIKYLPDDAQFGVLASAVLYAEHHRLIREQGYDVLSHRPTLSLADRLTLLARTWWHWRRVRDPETVFYRVSAVPETPEDAPDDSRPEKRRRRSSLETVTGSARSLVSGVWSRIPLVAFKL